MDSRPVFKGKVYKDQMHVWTTLKVPFFRRLLAIFCAEIKVEVEVYTEEVMPAHAAETKITTFYYWDLIERWWKSRKKYPYYFVAAGENDRWEGVPVSAIISQVNEDAFWTNAIREQAELVYKNVDIDGHLVYFPSFGRGYYMVHHESTAKYINANFLDLVNQEYTKIKFENISKNISDGGKQ